MPAASPERAWARARVPPQLRVGKKRVRRQGIDVGGHLHVAQVAPVVVDTGSLVVGPAQEHVAGGLHEPLTLDGAPGVVVVGGAPEVRLEHRLLRFLDLQDERVVVPASFQERDPAASPDAADPHHLASSILQGEPVEEVGDFVGEARPIPVEQRLHLVELIVAADMTHQRRLVDDPATTVGDRGEPVHGLQIAVRVRPRDASVEHGAGLCITLRFRNCHDDVGIDAPAPRVERGCRCQAGQQVPVTRHHAQDGGAADLVGHALRPGRHREAGPQALEIPLPRARQGLVEVIDVEDQPAFRGGEPAEVHQVPITAKLHREPSARRRSQIGGHARRRSTEEAELRLCHPPVADRQELGHPALPLRHQHVHRIGPIRRRLPIAVSVPRTSLRSARTGRDAVGAIDRSGLAPQHRVGTGRTRRPVERGDVVRFPFVPAVFEAVLAITVPHSSAAGGRFRAEVDAPVARTSFDRAGRTVIARRG